MHGVHIEPYLQAAEQLDRQITDYFGASPDMSVAVSTRSESSPVLTEPYDKNPEYQVAELSNNLAVLSSPAAVGQIVALRRPVVVRGQQTEIINPAILQGGTPDGRGVNVMLLMDVLRPTDPYISEVQDVLLRTFARLNDPNTGDVSADAAGGAVAAEPGHTYLGLRTVTDPTLIQELERGRHPVHSWAEKGVAETISMRNEAMPGMFDMRLPDGRTRRIAPMRRTLRPGDGSAVILHPAYKNEAQYGIELPPERLALAIGIKAAESTVHRQPDQLRSRMMRSMEAMGGG